MMHQTELDALKSKLEDEKARLERSLSGVAKRDPENSSNWNPTFPAMGEGQNASSSMMEENADEMETFEAELETEDALESRLNDVLRALKKIEEGTFGSCEACGKDIPDDRLSANPAARFDMEHEPT